MTDSKADDYFGGLVRGMPSNRKFLDVGELIGGCEGFQLVISDRVWNELVIGTRRGGFYDCSRRWDKISILACIEHGGFLPCLL